MTNAIARFKGQRASKEEVQSVAHFIDKLLLSSGLLNDLYSFHKEFEDHSATDNVDTIGNVMVLLMSSYGYTENEAASIVKQEIKTLEEEALRQFHTWQDSKPAKSHSLVAYTFTVMNMIGGMNYWMSHSERYFRPNLTTTAEDRAKLVGDRPGLRCLSNHLAPLDKKHYDTTVSSDSEFNKASTDFTRAVSDHISPGLDGSRDIAASITSQFRKADSEKLCMAPYDYISSLPGKGTIAKLVEASRAWLKVPIESTETIKKLTVIIFNSSLMLDDIQDDSVKRRGMPATHIMHGIGQTVNCVTYMGFKAFRICEDLSRPDECRQVLYDDMEALIYGQALELYWKFHRQCPSMSEYLVMIDNKTGGFFRLVIRLMIAEAPELISCAEKLAHFATVLGRFYQIRDDYQNLVSEEYTATKGFCDDLAEGKFSIMLIHTLQNSPTADRIRGLLFGGTRVGMPEEIRSYILSEMRAAGSLEYTRRIILEVYGTLLELLDELEAGIGRNDLLRNLILFLKV
ncbi:hypothetical protein N7456_005285 [Penicillium angulare]|uniref:Uncharacterized protein n=1 Tax=Penicillium angulare TaxID=116970 RepID=A0A9W9FY57_9EURO|nr:hypothetical protein N7456_005285 [Penicillium angulare]